MIPTQPEPRADGKLEIEVTDLEMTNKPVRSNRVPLAGTTLDVRRAKQPTLHFYRYLYETVGTPYLWFSRSVMSDEALSAIIHDERVELLVLYVDGCPAGFAELDRRAGAADTDIQYFGLVSEHLGQGFGLRFLDRVVDYAWDGDTTRLTVHVAAFDHPRALMIYQRAGFVPCGHHTLVVADPRAG